MNLLFAVIGIISTSRGFGAMGQDPMEATLKDYIAKGYSPGSDSFVSLNNESLTDDYLQYYGDCATKFYDFINKNNIYLTSMPPDSPTYIAFRIFVTNLDDVSDMDQTVTLTSILEIKWIDTRLLESAGSACQMPFVLPYLKDKIWFSPISVENSASGDLLLFRASEKFPVFVHTSEGVVLWQSAFRLVLNCDMNLKIYPFDWQNCKVTVRLPYMAQEVSVLPTEPGQALFLWDNNVDHPLWHITGQMVSPNLPTGGLVVYFRIVRKSTYFVWVLLMPTIVISIGTILPFIMPADSGERMSTMLTSLLSYFLLMVTLTSTTPQTSDNMPVLLSFFVIVIGAGMAGALILAIYTRVFSENSSAQKRSSARRQGLLECSAMNKDCANTVCLIIYVIALLGAYAFLYFRLEAGRIEIANEDAGKYNYTAINYAFPP